MAVIIEKQYHIIANVITSPVFIVMKKTYKKSTIGNTLVLNARIDRIPNLDKYTIIENKPTVPAITAIDNNILCESLSSLNRNNRCSTYPFLPAIHSISF